MYLFILIFITFSYFFIIYFCIFLCTVFLINYICIFFFFHQVGLNLGKRNSNSTISLSSVDLHMHLLYAYHMDTSWLIFTQSYTQVKLQKIRPVHVSMIHNSFKGQDGLYQQCRNVQPYREGLQSEGFVYGALACWAGISLA